MKTATAQALARLEAWTWALIFGGLFSVVLGLATRREDQAIAWVLMLVGAVATAVGVVLIFVRARMVEAPGAQSDA
ncbi:MAG TPA: hypothetical protein VIL30_13790 [Ramlibacter sp.]